MESNTLQPPILEIIVLQRPTLADEALVKFAQFLGVQHKFLDLNDVTGHRSAVLPQMVAFELDVYRCPNKRKLVDSLVEGVPIVFVYGCGGTEGDDDTLACLTDGLVRSVSKLGSGSHTFTVHEDVTHNGFPVSGMSYESESGPVPVLKIEEIYKPEVESYITCDGAPMLVAVKRESSLVFVLAGNGLVDIDQPAAGRGEPLKPWYPDLIVLAMIVRSAYKDWCWQAPLIPANIIIDDPGLKRRYGFIRYEKLIRHLRHEHGALTVAFIPYNYKGSDPETVHMLSRNGNHFSIAVHGCDHTASEYGSLDEAWLTATTQCALGRMQEHSDAYGIPFDNIMVFPQGKFSIKAVKALKACRMLAAVNSGAWPIDEKPDRQPLTIRDYLEPAVTRYHDYPIFVRRYPGDDFAFAVDALFEKPLLIVEHHGYFREGYGDLTSLIRSISALSGRIKWLPLGKVIEKSYRIRKTASGEYCVRQYGDRIRLLNPHVGESVFFVERIGDFSNESVAVNVDGVSVEHSTVDGRLCYVVRLSSRQEAVLQIVRSTIPPADRPISSSYRIKLYFRRKLSDFRDNHLARSRWVLAILERLKRALW